MSLRVKSRTIFRLFSRDTASYFPLKTLSVYAPVPPLLHLAPAYAPPATDEVHCAPNQQYILPHSVYCDRFYSCDNGTPVMYQCEDGYAFHPEKQECKLLHLVKCGSRTKLREYDGP